MSDVLAGLVAAVAGPRRAPLAAALARAGADVADLGHEREPAAVETAVEAALGAYGRLDVLAVAPALPASAPLPEVADDEWPAAVDGVLTYCFDLVQAVAPHLIAGERGGTVAFVLSDAGLRGAVGATTAASVEHGLVGLVRTLALELGRYAIRVHSLHVPATDGASVRRSPALPGDRPGLDAAAEQLVYLASPGGRHLTGTSLPVDGGLSLW